MTAYVNENCIGCGMCADFAELFIHKISLNI